MNLPPSERSDEERTAMGVSICPKINQTVSLRCLLSSGRAFGGMRRQDRIGMPMTVGQFALCRCGFGERGGATTVHVDHAPVPTLRA